MDSQPKKNINLNNTFFIFYLITVNTEWIMTDVTKEKENKGRAKIHTPVLELYVTNVKLVSKYHKMMIYFCLCLFEKKKRK